MELRWMRPRDGDAAEQPARVPIPASRARADLREDRAVPVSSWEVVPTRYADGSTGRQAWWWCPGCDEPHAVPVEGAANSSGAGPWALALDADGRPTLSPSILVHGWKATEPGFKSQPRCHSFVVAGRIQFLGDCEHALAGQTVPIPDEPPIDKAPPSP